jgi:uncharacterized membrane protein YesL
MGLAVRALGAAFAQSARRLERVLVGNLLATLVGFPVFIVSGLVAYGSRDVTLGALVAALLFGVLPNPAAGGMQLMAHDMAAGEFLLMPGPIEGIRRYWRVALKCWLIGVPVSCILFFNCVFYTQVHFPGSLLAELIVIYLLISWLAAHVYIYPLIIKQEVKKIRYVYRNAFVIALSHPLFTVQVAIVWMAVLLLTAASGLIVVVGLGLAASIQQNAAARMIPRFADKDASKRDPATT